MFRRVGPEDSTLLHYPSNLWRRPLVGNSIPIVFSYLPSSESLAASIRFGALDECQACARDAWYRWCVAAMHRIRHHFWRHPLVVRKLLKARRHFASRPLQPTANSAGGFESRADSRESRAAVGMAESSAAGCHFTSTAVGRNDTGIALGFAGGNTGTMGRSTAGATAVRQLADFRARVPAETWTMDSWSPTLRATPFHTRVRVSPAFKTDTCHRSV
jgi:hypothetical protein